MAVAIWFSAFVGTAPAPGQVEESSLSAETRAALEEQVSAIRPGVAKARWTCLPGWVTNVELDSLGRSWVRVQGLLPNTGHQWFGPEDLRAAARGETCVLPSALVCVDRAGRLYMDEPIWRSELAVWDGKGRTVQPLNIGPFKESKRKVRVQRPYLLSSNGDLWLLIAPDGLREFAALRRRATDDAWEIHPMPNLPDPRMFDSILDDGVFREQTQGRILLYPDNISTVDDIPIFRFDGKAWHTAHILNNDYVETMRLFPLNNGALGAILEDKKFRLYWPDPELAQAEARTAIKLLADESPFVRDAASWRLRQVDKAAEPLVREALAGQDVVPEARIRMEKALDAMGEPDAERDPLLAGRFTCGWIDRRGISSGAETMFFATDVTDTVDGTEYPCALLRFANDGGIRVMRLPERFVERETFLTDSGMVDSKGRVWMPGNRLLLPDGRLVAAAPPGVALNRFIGETRDGKIIAEGGCRHYVFDDRVAESTEFAPLVPSWTLLGSSARDHRLYVSDAAGRVGLVKGKDKVEWLTVPEEFLPVTSVMPLRDGSALAMRTVDEATRYFDLLTGKETSFLSGDQLEYPKLWAQRLWSSVIDSSTLVYASDGQNQFWFNSMQEAFEYPHIMHTDGKVVTDVTVKAKLIPGGAYWLRMADGGRTLLAYDTNQAYNSVPQPQLLNAVKKATLRAISVKDGEVHIREIPDVALPEAEGYGTINVGDDLYLRSGKATCVYRNGELRKLDFDGEPWLLDKESRVWFLNPAKGEVFALKDGRVSRGSLDYGLPYTMMAGPDGRVWLLHAEAASALRTSADGSAVVETHRARWPVTRSILDVLTIDPENGLWHQGNGPELLVRYQLPPEQ